MADTWEALEQACGQCRNCALAETRLHVVFGDGARDAEILLVGEGPGQREDEQGIPFVGKAGMLLDDMLEIIGLTGRRYTLPTLSSAARRTTGIP